MSEKSAIRSIPDLIGKRVTTTRGSVGHELLLAALEGAEISPDRVTPVFLPPGDAKAAFDNGAVDAWAIWPPYLTIAAQQGARIVVDAADYHLPRTFDIAHIDAVANKKALIRDFLIRVEKAQAWSRANPDAYAQVLAKEIGLPLDVAQASFEAMNWRLAQLSPEDALQMDEVARRYARAGLVDLRRPIAEAFDTSVTAGLFGAVDGPPPVLSSTP